jgi:fumarate hydratase, class I
MKHTDRWTDAFLELVRRTSTDLPADIERRLRLLRAAESAGSRARWALDTILENTALARRKDAPICQDTGTPLFFLRVPRGADHLKLESAIRNAVARATRKGWLRQNAIDSLTGRGCADNLAAGLPSIHIEQAAVRNVEAWLVLKGGGSENMGAQYSLPDDALGAGRDLEGVRRCILDALVRAQGNGCAPGLLGVCVGGDRSSGMLHAKRQFLRPLKDRAADPDLARLEARVAREAGELGIGPMGFGGLGTVMGIKIGTLARLPACYFVSVAYMCWAFRRRGFKARPDGSGVKWLSP